MIETATLEPSATEKRLATVLHLATIPAPIAAPLVCLAVARKSAYVKAHALHSLLGMLLLNLAIGLALACSFAYTLTRLWHHYQTDFAQFSVSEFLIRFLIGWLILGLLAAINTVSALRWAFRANAGVWPKKPRRSHPGGRA